MTARMIYLVCRTAEDRPEGVVYFRGTYAIHRSRRQGTVLVIDSSMFRRDAWAGELVSAQMIADLANRLGPSAGMPDAHKWEVLPAAIEVPRPYQPQEKSADERHRGGRR